MKTGWHTPEAMREMAERLKSIGYLMDSAESIDLLDEVIAMLREIADGMESGKLMKLDRPARVGVVTFGTGIPWKTVIDCAHRAYLEKPLSDDVIATIRNIAAGG